MHNSSYIDWTVGSVIKIKNKYGFRVNVLLDDHKKKVRQYGGFKTRKEADTERNHIIAMLDTGKYTIDTMITIEEFFDSWLKSNMKDIVKASTYNTYFYQLKNNIYPYIGNLKLCKLKREHIIALYNEVSKRSHSSAKLCGVILKTGLRCAEMQQLINNNSAQSVRLPERIHEHNAPVKKQSTLTLEQCKLIVEKSKSTKIYLFVLFALLMGMRKSEIIGLKYSDVDYMERTVHVKRQLGRDYAKDQELISEKSITKQEILPKTKAGDRILPLPDIVFKAILEERSNYEKHMRRRVKEFQNLDFICCSSYGSPRSASFVQKPYKELLLENGLPDIRFHDLRRTYATLLIKEEISLRAVSACLGHAKPIITMDLYCDNNGILNNESEKIIPFVNMVLPDVYQPEHLHDVTDECISDRMIKSLLYT